MNDIIIAFVSNYDSSILFIREGYESWADACADARRRNDELGYQLNGIHGRYDAYRRYELEYIG